MNAALLDYQRRAREDAELNALLERRRRATTAAEQQALDALIQARRLEHERASGLYDRLHNPEENESARGAGGRRKDAIDRQQEEFLGRSPHLSEEETATARRLAGGDTEIQRADAILNAEARQGRSQAEIDANLLAAAGGITPTSTAGIRVPGGSPGPAVVVRTETPTPDQTLHPRPTVLADAPPTGPRQGIG